MFSHSATITVAVSDNCLCGERQPALGQDGVGVALMGAAANQRALKHKQISVQDVYLSIYIKNTYDIVNHDISSNNCDKICHKCDF